MKFILTADLHLKNWSDSLINDMPRRLFETFNTIEQMIKTAKERNISNIIIAGDTNDLKGVINTKAFILFKRLILDKYKDIHWIILHGNHDSSEDNCSSIELLDYDNTELIIKPTIIDNILFFPFCRNMKTKFKEYLKSLDTIPPVLISHFGLTGAELSNGISLVCDINATDLRQFKLVLLGHYHKPQEYDTGINKIYYVGSPIILRRDEANDEKRFLVVDTETMNVKSIKTDGYRKIISITIDENTDMKELEKYIKQCEKEGIQLIIKQRIRTIPEELKKKFEKLANDTGNIQIIDMSEIEVANRGLSLNMSLEEQAKKYLEIMQIPESEISEYIKIFEEICRDQ